MICSHCLVINRKFVATGLKSYIEFICLFRGKLLFEKKIVCPCCEKTKGKSDTTAINRVIESLFKNEKVWFELFLGKNRDVAFKNFTSSNKWACDTCIDLGLAVEATIEYQLFCDYIPFASYYDKQQKCHSCKCIFVFSKEEQVYWFESLKFWVQSEAINCKSCRKIKRERKARISNAQTKISLLLPNLNIEDENQLQDLIQLYRETESINQVRKYSAMLKKTVSKS